MCVHFLSESIFLAFWPNIQEIPFVMHETAFHHFFSYLPLVVVLTSYTLIIYLLAFLAKRRTKRVADYVLGSRHLSGFVTALSAGASDMSSWLLMALPGLVMVKGLSVVWLPLSLTLGAYANWHIVAKRLRIYTALLEDALTIPAYLSRRFGALGRQIRFVSSASIMLFFSFYAVAGFVSAAKLTELTLGVSYQQALWGSGLFIVAYTAIGGFLAVSWVDVFQGLLMCFALLTVPVVGYYQLDSFSDAFHALTLVKAGYGNVTEGVTLLGILSLFAWGLGYVGQPHIIGRFMAIRDSRELPLARRICTGWMSVAMMGACLVGVIGAIHYKDGALEDPETVFLALSKKFFNAWFNAVLLCAVLSSIMSTVSCLILIAASALVEDFGQVIFAPKKGNLNNLTIHRLAVLLVSLVAMVMASAPSLTIMESVAFPWCGLGASLGPVIVLSLYWKRMTAQGALAGMVSGAAFVLLWEILRNMGNVYVNHPSLLAGFCLLPAFILSVTTIIGVSYRTATPSDEVIGLFEEMEEKVG